MRLLIAWCRFLKIKYESLSCTVSDFLGCFFFFFLSQFKHMPGSLTCKYKTLLSIFYCYKLSKIIHIFTMVLIHTDFNTFSCNMKSLLKKKKEKRKGKERKGKRKSVLECITGYGCQKKSKTIWLAHINCNYWINLQQMYCFSKTLEHVASIAKVVDLTYNRLYLQCSVALDKSTSQMHKC